MTNQTILTDEIRDKLIAAACEVRGQAYAPYSHYPVGSALLTDDGRIFTGVNVENASYGMTICAERNAVAAMAAAGGRHVRAIAICTRNGVPPCGACRQVLNEFAPDESDMPVWLVDEYGHVRETTLFTLMPDRFGAQDLE